MRLPGIFDVWNKRTVAHSPDTRPIWNLQELVYNYSASFIYAGQRRHKRTGHGSRSPHQRVTWNWGPVSQEYFVLCHALNSGVKPDFHTAQLEHLLRVSSQ